MDHRHLVIFAGRTKEKEEFPHSSILAWEVPWTEEPGGWVAGYSLCGRKELDSPLASGGWAAKRSAGYVP